MFELADRIHLEEMLEATAKIERFLAGRREADLIGEPLIADAVSLNLLVIGEGAARLSSPAKSLAQDVPWADLIGLRNRIAHGYARIDLRIVWRIATEDLPPLADRLRALKDSIARESDA